MGDLDEMMKQVEREHGALVKQRHEDIQNVFFLYEGGTVYEMCAWTMPHGAIAALGMGVEDYVMTSNYRSDEWLELAVNLGRTVLNSGYGDYKLSSQIFSNMQGTEEIELRIKKYIDEMIPVAGRNYFFDTHLDEDVREEVEDLTRRLLEDLGIRHIYHTMPPVLPDGVNPSMILESQGLTYLHEPAGILLEAWDVLQPGGYLVINERRDRIERLRGIPSYIDGVLTHLLPYEVEIPLHYPENYIILRKPQQ